MNFKSIKTSYPKLVSLWGSGKNYQKPNVRLKNSFEAVQSLVGFEGIVVLDIGCNNGLVSAVASEVFHSVVSLEYKLERAQKAKKTKKFFVLNNMKVVHSTFLEYAKSEGLVHDKVKAVVAFQVLYHMTTEEIDLLREHMPNVQCCILGSRPGKSHSNNKYRMTKVDDIQKFMLPFFNRIDVMFSRSKWPLLVGKKLNQ